MSHLDQIARSGGGGDGGPPAAKIGPAPTGRAKCSKCAATIEKGTLRATTFSASAPQKLAGQCGKLKCCLNYELDFYQNALKGFPKSNTKILTEKGIAYCQKIDIFKGLLWFVYKNDSVDWFELTVEKVKEIIKINAAGKKITSLEEYASENEESEDVEFQNVVGQDSLTRFDKKKFKKRRKKKV